MNLRDLIKVETGKDTIYVSKDKIVSLGLTKDKKAFYIYTILANKTPVMTPPISPQQGLFQSVEVTTTVSDAPDIFIPCESKEKAQELLISVLKQFDDEEEYPIQSYDEYYGKKGK